MLNSPQRRWDSKRVCSNTRGVNCTVCWSYGDIWTINMYIYIYIYMQILWQSTHFQSLLQQQSFPYLLGKYDIPCYSGGHISKWQYFWETFLMTKCTVKMTVKFDKWYANLKWDFLENSLQTDFLLSVTPVIVGLSNMTSFQVFQAQYTQNRSCHGCTLHVTSKMSMTTVCINILLLVKFYCWRHDNNWVVGKKNPTSTPESNTTSFWSSNIRRITRNCWFFIIIHYTSKLRLKQYPGNSTNMLLP